MVSVIAAMGKNRELGSQNRLPWQLPDDLKRFRELTKGHAVIMGRKTYESIGRPLPQRKNIVITRGADYAAPGCVVVNSMEAALEAAKGDSEAFVIGGAEIYKLFLQYAERMYLTMVDAEVSADAFFPEFSEDEWSLVSSDTHERDANHAYRFVFKIYERKNKQ